MTFEELLAQSYRIARALERTGHSRHEGIVCLTANSPEMIALRLAAHVLGSRFTALNVNTAGDVAGCHEILARARPGVLVVDRRGAEALAEPVPGMLTLGVPGEGATCWPWPPKSPGSRCARAPVRRTSPCWSLRAARRESGGARSTRSPR
ncbi:hypothetical protein SHKM778_47220 [Streptomyces sp. KM77-8]|uniref:AMP-dependent synthetase/ligase domain-containing protein n=1 Tax=Streptomyces haneummycinicus TaxID=3074435 RepID=A0AAT9HLU5_9ACTN